MEEIKYIVQDKEDSSINLRRIIAALVKRKLLFVFTFLAVVALTLVWVSVSKPYYNTKVSIGSAYFSGNAIEAMVNLLSDFQKDKNYEALAGKFRGSVEVAQSVLNIQLKNSTTQGDFYTADIALRVDDPAKIPEISQGIMRFFENNPFVKNRVEVLQEELLEFTKNGESQLAALDSMQSDLKNILADEGKLKGTLVLPSSIHMESVLINEKLYEARQDLKLLRGIELLAQPAVPQHPANPPAVIVILGGIIAGLFAGLFVVLGVEVVTESMTD